MVTDIFIFITLSPLEVANEDIQENVNPDGRQVCKQSPARGEY